MKLNLDKCKCEVLDSKGEGNCSITKCDPGMVLNKKLCKCEHPNASECEEHCTPEMMAIPGRCECLYFY